MFDQNTYTQLVAAQQLQDVANHVLQAALKPSTSKAYQPHWDSFVQFVMQFLKSPFQLPIDIHVLIMFLSYLFEQGKGYSTILGYLSGVGYHMKFEGSIRHLVSQVVGLLPINMPILVRLNRVVSLSVIISCSYEKKL